MAVTVLIPTPLRAFAGGREAIELEATSVGDVLDRLTGEPAALKPHLFATDGRLRSFVNVYVNDRDIRQLAQRETPLKSGDTVSIIPSIAGGTAVADALPKLSHEEILRYSRHLILPDVGVTGQRKLKSARVLLVGAGGLGSPAALYLAAAGVGTIGIVDFDVVDQTNLQRQILHGTSRVGVSKLQSAEERLRDINPNVRVETFETRLTSGNALDIIRDFDVVADGTDNFPTRYLVNDACVLLGKPNVYGSIFRFEGQASVFYAKEGPCYRCLYAEPPPPGLVPSCAEGGVLGVLPGIIGSIQALDVREPHEHEIARIEGAKLIPLSQLPDRLGDLDGHQEIVTHCHHGARSLKALEILKAAGFSKVRSLRGGIDAWSVNVDSSVPRY